MRSKKHPRTSVKPLWEPFEKGKALSCVCLHSQLESPLSVAIPDASDGPTLPNQRVTLTKLHLDVTGPH